MLGQITPEMLQSFDAVTLPPAAHSERRRIHKLLVANRGEIAIRVFRAASELGITTVAVYAEQDRHSLHRSKADEAYQVGRGKGPIEAYLDVDDLIAVAKTAGADAVHPGYGFLSEQPGFADACADAGLLFIGPSAETMRLLGNKVRARNIAVAAGVPVMPASPPLSHDVRACAEAAARVGYPLMLKASWGGGGRGMRVVEGEQDLAHNILAARREAGAAFGQDEIYVEKLVRRARHLEVQILGDRYGTIVHLHERDCSIQRRHQKVIERAPAPDLAEHTRAALCGTAVAIARATSYVGAGTVEFLLDADSGEFYFIEVNPRIQVEHTVTEQITGIDIVKAQIRIAEGGRIGDPDTGVPLQPDIRAQGHALQCRITTEDPQRGFLPDHGRITAYRGANGFGIRLDGGTAYPGALVTRHYDPLLEKVTAWAPSAPEATARMLRALREFRIRGVATNLAFLEAILEHPTFRRGDYTTRFIDETRELFEHPPKQDRATRLLRYIGEVMVRGHPDVVGRPKPSATRVPAAIALSCPPPAGSRDLLLQLGPEGFAGWMLKQDRVLVTDTTMRDAHQSLLATRMRTYDLISAAGGYASDLPQLLSLECWGGATFDVSMRFLQECPWDRLEVLRERVPNILLQMLLRGSNAVGYTNYPDNVVRYFIRQAARAGIDLFRVFDCLNWTENMRVAMDAVLDESKLLEAAICYTGDILDPRRSKYDLDYYVGLARQLQRAGAHILCVKDMAGLLRPAAARLLIRALKDETGLPLHLHTHDTTGFAAATLMAAIEAGVDAVDAAVDSLSGTTSQPCLGSLVEALRNTPRDTKLDPAHVRRLSDHWETIRGQYAAFETDQKSGASEVYLHEMPGGQFTNLKEQARALGLEGRWPEVAQAYADVNRLFGDIVKVTPTSKVVGDMALLVVSQGLTTADLMDPGREVAFPESVVQFMRGELGQPQGGFPQELQRKVLKGGEPIRVRPGSLLPPEDIPARKAQAERELGRELSERDVASLLMYPKVFLDYSRRQAADGPVTVLPTTVFYYGLSPGQEVTVALERGKDLIIRCVAVGKPDADGQVEVFFELNGQPRVVQVSSTATERAAPRRRRAQAGDPTHIAAPMPGMITMIAVAPGSRVEAGQVLLCVEGMKMETSVTSPRDGLVEELLVSVGATVEPQDLVAVISSAA